MDGNLSFRFSIYAMRIYESMEKIEKKALKNYNVAYHGLLGLGALGSINSAHAYLLDKPSIADAFILIGAFTAFNLSTQLWALRRYGR